MNVAVAPAGVTVSLPGLDPHDMERRRYVYNSLFPSHRDVGKLPNNQLLYRKVELCVFVLVLT